jgi:hypothetical protein
VTQPPNPQVRPSHDILKRYKGKGGHHRVVPAADRFLAELGCYLHEERPSASATDRVFTALKGPRRGMPLPAEGLDEIMDGARRCRRPRRPRRRPAPGA